MVTIIYPKLNFPCGYQTYTQQVLKGLKVFSYPYRDFGISKKEFSFLGKPFGGLVSQKLFASIYAAAEHPIHALSPEVAPSAVDIVTVHDVIPYVFPELYTGNEYNSTAFKWTFMNVKNADVVIAMSETSKVNIAKVLNIDSKMIEVISPSVDHSTFYPDSNSPYPENGKFHLVTVGDYNVRKRHELLYEMVSHEKDIELYHIGIANTNDAIGARLTKIAKSTDNIFMLGDVDNDTIRRYLSNADLFVSMAVDEGFGIPPVEAMACGTNVLLNDIPVYREIEGDMASYCTVDSFISAVYKAIVLHKHTDKDLVTYSERFSMANQTRKLIELYNRLSKKNTTTGSGWNNVHSMLGMQRDAA